MVIVRTVAMSSPLHDTKTTPLLVKLRDASVQLAVVILILHVAKDQNRLDEKQKIKCKHKIKLIS